MKGIILSSEMIQAVLDNRKTMTRRVIKINGQPITSPDESLELTTEGLIYHSVNSMSGYYKLPYKPGDILYVKETWQDLSDNEGEYLYFAEGNKGLADRGWGALTINDIRWRPSIFMPREAARIFLLVKDVRVERLQDITEEDAKAEGCHERLLNDGWKNIGKLTARDDFIMLWEYLNAKRGYGWDTNPWVWVIEFKRITKEEALRLEGTT